MKKIYLFLIALFSLFGSATLFAQDYTPDGKYQVDDSYPIILEVSQLSSPMMETREGSWEGMIDMDATTFWHSSWASVAEVGTHYFQVEIASTYEADLGNLCFIYVRRGASNDQTLKWSVRGTNNPDAAKDDCEELAIVETPNKDQARYVSNAFDPKGYAYLRFYSELQSPYGDYPNGRGYFHVGDFQLYPVIKLTDKETVSNLMFEASNKYEAEFIKYPGGTQPGRYPQELVDALRAAIDKLNLDDTELYPNDDAWPTEEGVAELTKACDDAIAALNEAGKNPYSIETGYYRIKAGMMYNDGVDRYMCGYLAESKLWGIWSGVDLSDPVDAAQSLWYIENKGDGTYDFVSQYHDGRFLDIARSGNVEMSTESTNLMAIDVVNTDDEGFTYVNIRVATQNGADGLYLHQGGHGDGGGTNGYMVGWYNTYSYTDGAKATEWVFEPVDESDAQQIIDDYAPYKDKFKWLDDFRNRIAQAQPALEVAKDLVDTATPLITSADQLSSPCSDSAEGTNIGALIDGNTGTFWHTDWHSEYVGEDHHYLQVELVDDVETVAFQFTRRQADNDHTISWQVYGTNDPDEGIFMGDCELLAEVSTPFTSNTETLTSQAFATNGYKYLRFYSIEQHPSTRTYWHVSEFQLYPAREAPSQTSQYAVMGDVASTLDALVEQFKDAENDDIEYDDYQALVAAYDAFMAQYVDPAPLRQAIRTANQTLNTVVVGTAPGFWTQDGAADLIGAVNEAKTYNDAGAYSQAEIDNLISKMQAEAEAVPAKANPVQEGKWYRIRYGTEDEYAKYSWPTSGNGVRYWKSVDEYGDGADNILDESIYGKYMTVAGYETETLGQNDDGSDANAGRILPIDKAEIAIEHNVFADAAEDIEDKDMSLWRFIKQGDGFIIQNKATGLFIHCPGGNVQLTPSPSVFEHLAAGYGQNSFIASRLDGEVVSPLHLAQINNIFCTWGSKQDDGIWQGMGSKDGRRACFFVEEVEDVAADYAFGDFKINFVPGDIYGRCYPVPITVKDPSQGELWTVNAVESTEETVSVTLAKITDTQIPAGRPFIYIADGEFDEEAEAVPSDFSFTLDLITEPQTSGLLKGTFETITINERYVGIGVGHEDQAFQLKESGTSVAGNRVYITPNGEPIGSSAVLEFTFDGDAQDGIQAALQNIARKGAIYTVDGRLVGNGNLNDLKQKGIYILNGTKVIVK